MEDKYDEEMRIFVKIIVDKIEGLGYKAKAFEDTANPGELTPEELKTEKVWAIDIKRQAQDLTPADDWEDQFGKGDKDQIRVRIDLQQWVDNPYMRFTVWPWWRLREKLETELYPLENSINELRRWLDKLPELLKEKLG